MGKPKNWRRDELGQPEWIIEDQDGNRQAVYNWKGATGLVLAGGAGGNSRSQSSKMVTGLVGTIAAAAVALVLVVGYSAYTALQEGVPTNVVLEEATSDFWKGAEEKALEGAIDAVNPLGATNESNTDTADAGSSSDGGGSSPANSDTAGTGPTETSEINEEASEKATGTASETVSETAKVESPKPPIPGDPSEIKKLATPQFTVPQVSAEEFQASTGGSIQSSQVDRQRLIDMANQRIMSQALLDTFMRETALIAEETEIDIEESSPSSIQP